MNWIKITDKLPEVSCRVIAHIKGSGVHTINFIKNHGGQKNVFSFEDRHDPYGTEEVTHWMPLPDNPWYPVGGVLNVGDMVFIAGMADILDKVEYLEYIKGTEHAYLYDMEAYYMVTDLQKAKQYES